jgi:histidinol-phosphate aminotransferase
MDEAYIDFIRETDYFDSIEWARKYSNVILLRTFSKVYGLAGLRIGYAIGQEHFINGLRVFKTPMSVNHIAIEAAVASLDDQEFHRFVIEQTGKQLDYYYREFDTLGLSYVRSDTNFLLVNIQRDSEEVVSQLREKRILVRGGREFGYPESLRITVGTEQENRIFIEALTEILS